MDKHQSLQSLGNSPEWQRRLLFVIGCPGSGKGTLCKLLAQEYRYQHISVGDLLRSIRDDPTNEDFELRDHVRQGTLVPTRTIVRILKEAISGGLASGSGVIVDGFPRHLDQGIALMEQLGKQPIFQFGKPDMVLHFKCDSSVALQRFMTRKLVGRLDDTEEIFHRRNNEFESLNPEITEHFRKEGLLGTVDTNGKTEDSYVALKQVLGFI